MVTNSFAAAHFTCIGVSHKRLNQPCQDASFSIKTKHYSMAVVCDGHGGGDYFRSDRGSKLAVKAFSACASDKDFLRRLEKASSKDQLAALAQQLVKSVILRWNEAVDADLIQNPILQSELEAVSDKARQRYLAGEKCQAIYGTTLLGFVCCKDRCFGVQIGDGSCVTADKYGELTIPIPADDKCFLNVTTSLSDENAFEEFRFWISQNLPLAVFLGTDGIENSFAGEEKLLDFYRLVLKNLVNGEWDAQTGELFAYLPQLSSQGSGDDISLGVLLNKEVDTWTIRGPNSITPG